MSIEITGGSGDVAVGEKIKLGLKYTVEWGVLKSVTWTIPGTIVKDYKDDATTAVKTDFPEADKTKPTIEFYWVDGQDGRKVEADCVFTSGGKDTNKKLTTTFNVKAPTLDEFTSKTGSVKLEPSAAPSKVTLSGPGIKWSWKVTVPSVVDGYLKDVQTIQTTTKRTKTDDTKQVWTISGTKVPPPDPQLDTTNPYSEPGDFSPTGFPKKVTKGTSFTDDFTSDSPGGPLAGTKRKFYHDIFQYYIMYKPDKPDAIWVPVAVAGWHWKADAVLGGSGWTLPTKDNPTDPSGAKTTTFPVYTSNVKTNGWEDEGP